MKISELKSWHLSNSLVDEWYVSVNSKPDQTIYRLSSVKKILQVHGPKGVHVVHVTQTPINGLEGWVKLEPNTLPTSGLNVTQKREEKKSITDPFPTAEKVTSIPYQVQYSDKRNPLFSIWLKIKNSGLSVRVYLVSGLSLFFALILHFKYQKQYEVIEFRYPQFYAEEIKALEDYRLGRNTALFLAATSFVIGFLMGGKNNDTSEPE